MFPAIAIVRFIAVYLTAFASGIRHKDRLCFQATAIAGTIVSNESPPVLISADDIDTRVTELAAQISEDYQDKGNIVLIGVLKGSFIFLADLARRLTIPRTIEFIAVSSYENGSIASGAVRLVMDVRGNIENRHVLIIEDIVDTGHTLSYLIGMLESHGPASIRTCTLLHKAESAEVDVAIDYIGFGIGDEWVVGYGLDYAEKNRTLPYIGTIEPDDAAEESPPSGQRNRRSLFRRLSDRFRNHA
jgi:hypoxanthine phosphoribosyltransferase